MKVALWVVEFQWLREPLCALLDCYVILSRDTEIGLGDEHDRWQTCSLARDLVDDLVILQCYDYEMEGYAKDLVE